MFLAKICLNLFWGLFGAIWQISDSTIVKIYSFPVEVFHVCLQYACMWHISPYHPQALLFGIPNHPNIACVRTEKGSYGVVEAVVNEKESHVGYTTRNCSGKTLDGSECLYILW